MCFLQNTKGMEWQNLNDPLNGMKTVLGIMVVEWLVFLIIAYYFEQVIASGSGVKKHPLYFLKFLYRGNKEKDVQTKNLLVPNEETNIEMDRPDVAQEVCVMLLMFLCYKERVSKTSYYFFLCPLVKIGNSNRLQVFHNSCSCDQ